MVHITHRRVTKHRAFHPRSSNYTFFSNVHEISSRIDLMLDDKNSLNKFKKTEVIPTILSNQKDLKLEINIKNKVKNKQINSQICGD